MSDEQQWTPPAERYVSVWPHTLGEFEKFPDAVATVQANGALIVTRWGAGGSVPIKGYAPGAWVTFEHVGDYTAAPRPSAPQERHPVPAALPDTLTALTDPFAELGEDRLAQTNGDVGHGTGIGNIPPYPEREEGGVGKSDPDVPRWEVVMAPKADTAVSPEDDGDTDVSVAGFVLGDWWDRLLNWRPGLPSWRRGRPESPACSPLPTHLLSRARPSSPTLAFVAASGFAGGLLILTQYH